MESYLGAIGKHIREIRKEKELYGSEIAIRAQVSNGLISRIENGRTIPSLPVLLSIIDALETEPSSFFQSIELHTFAKYMVIRADEHSTIEKEDDAVGFTYEFILNKQLQGIGLEMVLLTLEPDCQRDPVETDAYEFKYIISGQCNYIIDGETVSLYESDSIIFDGRLPHVPKNPYDDICKMLVFYYYTP